MKFSSSAADVVQMQSSGGEELESMNMESAQELSSGGTESFLLIKQRSQSSP